MHTSSRHRSQLSASSTAVTYAAQNSYSSSSSSSSASSSPAFRNSFITTPLTDNSTTSTTSTTTPPAPKALSSADAQNVQRQYSAFKKETKSLFALATKVLSSAKQYEMNCVHLTRQLKTLYESGESVLGRDVERLYAAIDDDDLNGVADIEDLEAELSRAEKWLYAAKKSLKGARPEETAYFMEQRFDGLDNAVMAFIRLAKKTLSQKAERASAAIEMSLGDVRTLERVCPTRRDGGITSVSSAENVVSQLIPAHYMHMYLASLLKEECVDFCMEVKALEELCRTLPADASAVIEKARFIAEEYVAETSSNDLGLSEDAKRRVMESLNSRPFSPEQFSAAAAEVICAMDAANAVDAFKQTPYYEKLIRRLTLRPYTPSSSLFGNPLPPPPLKTEDIATVNVAPVVTTTTTSSVTPSGGVVVVPPPPMPQQQQQQQQGKTDLRKSMRLDLAARQKRHQSFRRVLKHGASHTFMSLQSKDLPNGKLISITDVLQNRALYKDFKKFLQERGNVKPLDFVHEVCAFATKRFASHNDVRVAAAKIFETFLITNDNEPGIGASIETQQKLFTAIYERDDEPVRTSVFKTARTEVIEVMRLTVFVQYLISERWLAVTWTPDDVSPRSRLSGNTATNSNRRRNSAALSSSSSTVSTKPSVSVSALKSPAFAAVVPAPSVLSTQQHQQQHRMHSGGSTDYPLSALVAAAADLPPSILFSRIPPKSTSPSMQKPASTNRNSDGVLKQKQRRNTVSGPSTSPVITYQSPAPVPTIVTDEAPSPSTTLLTSPSDKHHKAHHHHHNSSSSSSSNNNNNSNSTHTSHSSRSRHKSKERSPTHRTSSTHSHSHKMSLNVPLPQVAPPVPSVTMPATITTSDEAIPLAMNVEHESNPLILDPEVTALVSVSPLRPLADSTANVSPPPPPPPSSSSSSSSSLVENESATATPTPEITSTTITTTTTTTSSTAPTLPTLATTGISVPYETLHDDDIEICIETPRTADARKGLLRNYRTVVLPKLEDLTAALSRLVDLEELAAQRENVRMIQTISRCLNGIVVPPNVPKPSFTVIHPNVKFVQFRKKLLYCTWEVGKKVSIIMQNLALNCPCDINTTMSGTLKKYLDVYHCILLAFSATQ